jgi:hypothetical protein
MPKRPTRLITRQRAEAILKLKLLGASQSDIKQYARQEDPEAGTPWTGPDGQPLSDRQLWRLSAQAEKLFGESMERERSQLLNHHLLLRRLLRARCIETGDLRGALASARDEALLLGLYPEQQRSPQNNNSTQINLWQPILQKMSDEDLAVLRRLAEQSMNGDAKNGTAHDQPAPIPVPYALLEAEPATGRTGDAGDVPALLRGVLQPDEDLE